MLGPEANRVPERAMQRGDVEDAAIQAFDATTRISDALAGAGLDVASLTVAERAELEGVISARLTAVVESIVEQWLEEHRNLTEQELIDRELRRRIAAEKAAIAAFHSDYECDGCGYHNREHLYFADFHGLYLCDGCVDHARDELRDLQRSLIEALEAEPTPERAHALGYDLIRRDDGRLVWVSDDDYDYDGGRHPYANEQEALAGLVAELT